MCVKRSRSGWVWLAALCWLLLGSWLGAETITVEKELWDETIAVLRVARDTVKNLEDKLATLETEHDSEVKEWETAYEKQGTLLRIAESNSKTYWENWKKSEKIEVRLWVLVGVLAAVGGIGWLL